MITEQIIERGGSENLRQIGGVIEIASFPEGLPMTSIEYLYDPTDFITGNQEEGHIENTEYSTELVTAFEKTKQERGAKGDFNGPKITVRKIAPMADRVTLVAGKTDYFTLWGIPKVAQELQENLVSQITTEGKTSIPVGISTHNIVITKDLRVVAKMSPYSAGFFGGRLGISFEEQMDPVRDTHPSHTPYRGLFEELGAEMPIDNFDNSTRLLGIAMEKEASYLSLCYLNVIDVDSKDLRNAWHGAKDHNESTILMFIPIDRISEFSGSQILPEVWRNAGPPSRTIWKEYGKTSKLEKSSILQTHPTVPWRIELLEKHIATL